MNDGRHRSRRGVLRASAAIAGLGVVAGCVSDDGNGSGNGDGSGNGTENGIDGNDNGTDGDGNGAEDDDSDDASSGSYAVTMEPVGTVEFDSVPETWAANNGSWADMGIALGQEAPEAVYLTSRYHTQYYDEIPSVSVDESDTTSLWEGELDPEEFLALSEAVDVFVMDPNFPVGRTDHWDESDIEQIEATGTPFFGNSIFSRDYGWHDDYEYLTLYEAFEKLSQVFQEEQRYTAFESLHDEFQDEVEAVVPPAGDRPDVAILWPAGDGAFYPYTIDEGTSFKQWRDLGVTDALGEAGVSDFLSDRGTIDYENLLEIDPEVLLLRSHEALSAEEFREEVVAEMETHSVASDLTAVQNGDVYRGGPLYQGPIANLVLTERGAQQLYDVDEELFDRQEVSDIVDGDF
ncbi:ABC transporter substrate-binding protein [Natronoglomus mannanivorans]|uniref:ABC transporter substrate-binding protein n=1 Tax=Natronoglomus mannanivorans TaxID=2979990 RepID=A0AAP2YXD9_9EURY|nr:ABC transporter substrate-binding protein [Halobacteria archaeon AArc-xg1-1]